MLALLLHLLILGAVFGFVLRSRENIGTLACFHVMVVECFLLFRLVKYFVGDAKTRNGGRRQNER